jgi:hypothetical protein
MNPSNRLMLALFIVVVLAATAVYAGVKVKVDYDKTFDFATTHTYAWHPDGAGETKILDTMGDDPVKVNAALEPMIVESVDRELAKRGFVLDTSGKPDLHLHYYVLIGPESDSQFRGQFIGGVPAWGLPDFEMSTTSLKVYEAGTVVLDVSTAANRSVVWRAIASAELQRQRTPAERKQRIDEGLRQALKKFPPKFKK